MSDWVSVKDALPDEEIVVMAFGHRFANKDGGYCFAFVCPVLERFVIQDDSFGWFFPEQCDEDHMSDEDDAKEITHWKYLEPPQ